MLSRGKTKTDPLDEVQKVMNRLSQAKEIVYDCETSGLDWRKQHIVGHVVTFGPTTSDSYYLPVRHAAGGNIGGAKGPQTDTGWDGKLHRVERDLIRTLDRPDLLITGHNLAFDLKFLFRLGFTFRPRFEDTIVNAPLLDEQQPRMSLEYCANVAKVEAKKGAEIVAYLCSRFPEAAKAPKQAMGHFWRLMGDDPLAVSYAAGDGTTTWQLRDWQMERIRRPDADGFDLVKVHDIESRLIPVLARMSTRGIKIDEERLSWLEKHIESEVDRLTSAFPSGFNVRSPDDVREWMEQHGHIDWPMTSGGTKGKPKPSMQEAWLENYPAGQSIIKVRKLETLKSSFVQPMRNEHLWKGRVHADYNQLRGDQFGTITGRLSSSNPNLQAVPKHNEVIGRLFRSIFVPDDGKTWGAADWSQMEPRLLAHYSRCRVLLDGYSATPPIDAHGAVSMAMCGQRWKTMSKQEQKDYRNNFGKRINQLIITGGGYKTLSQKYKIPLDEAEKKFREFFRVMPEVKTLQKNASMRMRSRGYVRSLLGRRALLEPGRDYVAVNRLLQCGNADAIKLKMVEIDDYLASEGRPVDLLNNFHDALDFQFEEGKGRKHYDECLSIMTRFGEGDAIPIDVPITVDAGDGASWAIATYGEEK